LQELQRQTFKHNTRKSTINTAIASNCMSSFWHNCWGHLQSHATSSHSYRPSVASELSVLRWELFGTPYRKSYSLNTS